MTDATTNDDDPGAHVAMLATIPDQLEAAIREAGAGTSATSADEWTPTEIVGHLGDAARYWGARMLRVAREDEPALPYWDENTMVDLAAYRYRDLDELLRVFRLTNAGNVAFLRGLPPAAWERAGMHETRGRITLREIVATEAGHQQGHVRQLRAALGLPPDYLGAFEAVSPEDVERHGEYYGASDANTDRARREG